MIKRAPYDCTARAGGFYPSGGVAPQEKFFSCPGIFKPGQVFVFPFFLERKNQRTSVKAVATAPVSPYNH